MASQARLIIDPEEFWLEPECGHANFDGCVPLDVYEERVVGSFDQSLLGE